MRNKRTVVILIFGLIGVFVIGLLVALGLGAVSTKTKLFTKDELLAELNQIRPPEGAVAVNDSVIVKNTHALVGKDYSLNATYEDLRKHYDAELASRGWQLVEERQLKSWSQDYGERSAHYCKNGMSAELFYNGNLATTRKYLYQLNLSSGLNNCK